MDHIPKVDDPQQMLRKSHEPPAPLTQQHRRAASQKRQLEQEKLRRLGAVFFFKGGRFGSMKTLQIYTAKMDYKHRGMIKQHTWTKHVNQQLDGGCCRV